MKVKVNSVCCDKYTHEMYKAGTVLTVTDERGAEMLASGLVEEVKEKPKSKPKKMTKAKA